jgi:opacity protein-like surface antigen
MRARGDKARFDLFSLTPMAMFRLPLLTSEEIPQGVLQPYAGLGPSLSLYTYTSADFGPPTNNINGWNMSLGLQMPAGVAVQLSKHIALFAEYRFAWYKVVVQDNDPYIGNSNNVARKITAALDIHNALFGISYRF